MFGMALQGLIISRLLDDQPKSLLHHSPKHVVHTAQAKTIWRYKKYITNFI